MNDGIIHKGDLTRPRMAAIGMFDGVHAGHCHLIDMLVRSAAERSLQPVAVTFADHPRALTDPEGAPRMLSSYRSRVGELVGAGAAGVVVLDFDERLRSMTARDFMAMLRRDYNVRALLMGYNNRFGHDRPEGIEAYRAIGRETGMEIVAADEYRAGEEHRHVSSSEVRRCLARGDVGAAAMLLGHEYTLEGIVEHGKQLGRSIGFPTANIHPCDPRRIIPANGVYAVRVALPDGTVRAGMMNIGHRPTVDTPDAPPSLEVHILDYDGDLYGREVSVSFVARLRDERRFPDIDRLRAQLTADALATRTLLR